MRKIEFNDRYGQIDATVAGTKTQFHNVEQRLIRQFESYPKSRVKAIGLPIDDSCDTITVHLNDGASFSYKPKYKIGEVVEVEGTNGACRIKITGINIQRLSNPSLEEMLNEGFSIMRLNGLRHYCYPDREKECLVYFRSYHQCWLSFLYRTMNSDVVVSNPYSVVYQFELIKD